MDFRMLTTPGGICLKIDVTEEVEISVACESFNLIPLCSGESYNKMDVRVFRGEEDLTEMIQQETEGYSSDYAIWPLRNWEHLEKIVRVCQKMFT